MGYVPEVDDGPRLHFDRWGLPADFATYEWVHYRRRVDDDDPARRAIEVRRMAAWAARPTTIPEERR